MAALDTLLADDKATDEAVEEAFHALTEAYMTAQTNYELLYFRSTMDVTDSAVSAAASDYYNLDVSIWDQMSSALKKILSTSHKDYVIKVEGLTDEDVEYYLAHEPMTDEEKSLSAEMQAIGFEYNLAYSAGFPVEYNGTAYTYESLDAGTVTDDDYNAISDLLDEAYYKGLGVEARLYPVYFSDVPKESPYYDSVTFLANIRGLAGCPDGTFQPDMDAHLCEALQVMYNCFSS